jgi:prevent-host-death family protein
MHKMHRRVREVIKVAAAEFQRNIGRYQDIAQREPVAVTRNGRESCVLMSAEEYQRLKRRDKRVFTIDEATEEEAALVAAQRYPEGYDHLDEELKDWNP